MSIRMTAKVLLSAGILCLAASVLAEDGSKKTSTHTYSLKPVYKTLYPGNGGAEDRAIRGPDEPIGVVRRPDDIDEATVALCNLISIHVEQQSWETSGGEPNKALKAVGESMEIRATERVHTAIERFLVAIAKPTKFNPKATAEELAAAAVYASEDQKTITLVYGLAPFPARVCGQKITGRTNRMQVIEALAERILTEVSPGKWQAKGNDTGAISEIAGRIVVTASVETHLELARKMQEWVKR